jgi:twitching motility protein PilT
VNLLDSLLDAIVRLEGDALVMHVGEKPYVVTATSAMSEHRGPLLWGHVDLSSRVLTSEAVLGMLGQIMPLEQRQSLEEVGAVEHYLEAERSNARFSVIAARAGDEVWLEVRKRPKEVPVAVAQPVVDEPAVATEPVIAPQAPAAIAAIEQSLQTSVERPSEEPIEEPVEVSIEEPVHVHDTAQPIEHTAIVESPAVVDGEEIEDEIEPALPIGIQREETTEAPFEIVHEVNQDAPTDADVDELLAASAAALLRSAAPALVREPLEVDEGAWLELEQPKAVALEPQPEPVSVIDEAASVVVAEVAQPVVPESMPLASEVRSIAIAPELGPVAIRSQLAPVPLIAEVEPSTMLGPGPSTMLGPVSESAAFVDDVLLPSTSIANAEVTEPIVPEPVAMVPESEPVLADADAECVPVAFDEEFELEEAFRLDAEATEFVPEFVAMVPQPELVLVGAAAAFEPVAFAEDFRLVAPTADTFAREPVAIEPELESVPVFADVGPDLFAFAEGFDPQTEGTEAVGAAPVAIAPEPEPMLVSSEPVLVSVDPEFEPVTLAEDVRPEQDVRAVTEATKGVVPEPIAAAPAPEPAEIFAETGPEPVYIEPEPVAAAPESDNLHEASESVVAAYASDLTAVHVQHQQPVMASVPTPEPEVQPERAVVVPLARRLPAVAPRDDAGGAKPGPVRQEPTPSTTADPAREFSIDDLLRVAAARGASTVYLVAQSRPMVRAEGDISVLDIGAGTPLEESDITRLMLDFAPATAREAWQHGTSAEWISDVADVGRVRCMTFRDHRGPGLIFRMIPPQALSADHLGLTHEVQALCTQSDGLVLVTGPRASGKSTLMSGFVDFINRTRSDHVITIESQIEFVHESRRSFVSQREARAGDEAVVSAVRSALREDPDVLFIGELSSAEVAAVALEAAESGRLVFATLPAASTVAAVDRLLELLPAESSQARASIAASLRGVVAQVLVGRTRGGRIAAREVLLNTAAVAGLIQEAKTSQLPLAMESGRRHGMMPLNDTLTALVRDGTVHVTEAYRKAFDKESLLAALQHEGIDTSFAEKIA